MKAVCLIAVVALALGCESIPKQKGTSPECVVVADYLHPDETIPVRMRLDPAKEIWFVVEDEIALEELAERYSADAKFSIHTHEETLETMKDVTTRESASMNLDILTLSRPRTVENKVTILLRKNPNSLGWDSIEYILEKKRREWTVSTRTVGVVIF